MPLSHALTMPRSSSRYVVYLIRRDMNWAGEAACEDRLYSMDPTRSSVRPGESELDWVRRRIAEYIHERSSSTAVLQSRILYDRNVDGSDEDEAVLSEHVTTEAGGRMLMQALVCTRRYAEYELQRRDPFGRSQRYAANGFDTVEPRRREEERRRENERAELLARAEQRATQRAENLISRAYSGKGWKDD